MIKKSIDYKKGLILEKEKLYTHAIRFYKIAVEQDTPYLLEIYYRLALLLDKTKKYEESCKAFLLMENITFKVDMGDSEFKEKNESILYQYLLEKEPLALDEWLWFGEEAESLKCWHLVSYAYKELLSRVDAFTPAYYTKLGYSLTQEKKYKESIKCFKEQMLGNQLDEHDKYKVYRDFFSLEERIIVYESNDIISSKVYELYVDINKDAHFDAYRHIWIVNSKDSLKKIVSNVNTIVVQKDSDLYKRYLAKAKYIIANKNIDSYYERKDKQYYIFTEENNKPIMATHYMDGKTTAYDIIQEVFFGNRKVAFPLKAQTGKINELYQQAIKEFDSKEWASCHKKFLEVKKQVINLNYPLATTYYIKESAFQLKVKSKKVEELLPYVQYKLSAEMFIGIDYLLEQASLNSVVNKEQWSQIRVNFLDILEDIKKNMTPNIRSIKDRYFLEKVKKMSTCFDDSLEANFLPYQAWFLFSHLFIFARLYKKYQLARTKGLACVLNKKAVSNTALRYKINALAEIKDKERYDVLREKLLKESVSYINENLQFLGASELYFNRHDSSISLYKQNYTKEEKAFAKYIENKSIAIVGPLQSTLSLGEEIDSYDVVLRFNYRGVDESLKKSNGIKTNLSFYILEILIKDRINATQINYINDLDWAIFDTGHNENSICFTGVTANLRSRYYDAYDYANPYFKGTANGIQRVLLDLLRFKVGKIKIYNTNLFLENSYEKDYKSRGSLGADHFNFIWHDPLSNFIFLKRLKEFSLIDSDEILTKILSLTPEQYIESLEMQYGRESI